MIGDQNWGDNLCGERPSRGLTVNQFTGLTGISTTSWGTGRSARKNLGSFFNPKPSQKNRGRGNCPTGVVWANGQGGRVSKLHSPSGARRICLGGRATRGGTVFPSLQKLAGQPRGRDQEKGLGSSWGVRHRRRQRFPRTSWASRSFFPGLPLDWWLLLNFVAGTLKP